MAKALVKAPLTAVTQPPPFTEEDLDKRIAAVTKESAAELAFLRTYEVTSSEDYETAAGQRAKLKAEMAAIEEERRSFTDPLNEVVKRINAKVKPATTFLDTAIKLINAAMGVYQQREEIRQRQALEEAQEMAVAGDVAGATLALARVESEMPKVTGLSSRDDWYVVSVDPDKLDRSLMMPDMVKINALVKEAKTVSPTPGVVAAVKKIITQRGAK